MILKTVDLYEFYNLDKPKFADGVLTCYIQQPCAAICANRKFPSVLIMPGGAYRYVSPRESEPVAMRYYAAGFSAFVLSYSIAPLSFPVALREAVMAIRYLRQHAEEYSLDPQKIAALGFSAGGHLLGCLSTMYDSEYVPKSNISARPNASVYCYPVITSGEKTHVESIYNISGTDSNLAEKLSVENHVHSKCPPAFIWHTHDDSSVPVKNSMLLACAYESVGVPFEMHIFQHGEHGMSTCDVMAYPSGSLPDCGDSTPEWIALSIKWLGKIDIAISDDHA